MIDFDTYLIIKIIAAVFGTLILFPLCLWWLNRRKDERKPLTKEQIAEIARYQDEHGQGPWYLSFARAIEKAHGIGGEA